MGSIYEKTTVTQYSVSPIHGYIDAGYIATPEIQRPFVWKAMPIITASVPIRKG